jgi:hypothetical protein
MSVSFVVSLDELSPTSPRCSCCQNKQRRMVNFRANWQKNYTCNHIIATAVRLYLKSFEPIFMQLPLERRLKRGRKNNCLLFCANPSPVKKKKQHDPSMLRLKKMKMIQHQLPQYQNDVEESPELVNRLKRQSFQNLFFFYC